MAYTKQTWNTGETITADKLNHMEDGIGTLSDYVLIINETSDGEGNLIYTAERTPFSGDGIPPIAIIYRDGTPYYMANHQANGIYCHMGIYPNNDQNGFVTILRPDSDDSSGTRYIEENYVFNLELTQDD